jgi:hypothetical protein
MNFRRGIVAIYVRVDNTSYGSGEYWPVVEVWGRHLQKGLLASDQKNNLGEAAGE